MAKQTKLEQLMESVLQELDITPEELGSLLADAESGFDRQSQRQAIQRIKSAKDGEAFLKLNTTIEKRVSTQLRKKRNK